MKTTIKLDENFYNFTPSNKSRIKMEISINSYRYSYLNQVHIFLKINHAVYIDNEENIFREI